jgi:hypothetical protein
MSSSGFAKNGWVLVIEDTRDQAELWSDVCLEAGLNTIATPTGVQGVSRRAPPSRRSSCWT